MGGRGSKITPVKVATLSSCPAYFRFHLFLYLKKHLASQKFHKDKVEKTVTKHLYTQRQCSTTSEYKNSHPR
jgi:hypothetical protein